MNTSLVIHLRTKQLMCLCGSWGSGLPTDVLFTSLSDPAPLRSVSFWKAEYSFGSPTPGVSAVHLNVGSLNYPFALQPLYFGVLLKLILYTFGTTSQRTSGCLVLLPVLQLVHLVSGLDSQLPSFKHFAMWHTCKGAHPIQYVSCFIAFSVLWDGY